MDKIKFGIIGCSKIAQRSVIPAILKSEFAEIEIIGSRNPEKAKQYSQQFSCDNYGTYSDVLKNNQVDAVYISTPIGLHEKWAIQAAESGKHILCEKSSSTSYDSAKKIIDSCKQNNVEILEGLMFQFHPRHIKVKEIISSGKLGDLFTLYAMYGFPPVDKTDVRYSKELGGGVLNETGCYPVCASRFIFGEATSVNCNLVYQNNLNVDIKGYASISFSDEKVSFVSFGFDNVYQANYKIWGSKGMLELNRAYAVPPDMQTSISMQLIESKDEIHIEPSDHFTQMIDAFSANIAKTAQISLDTKKELLEQARLMQAMRESSKSQKTCYLDEIS